MLKHLPPPWVRTALGLCLLATSLAAQGPFVETAELTAADGSVGDVLGKSIAISGKVLAVGAPQADVGGNVVQGAVYVYVKPEGPWVDATQTAKLTASDGQSSDYFGSSVAISGDTIVVGADQDQLFTPGTGAAYVFVKPVGGWVSGTETAKLTASDATTGDAFGCSIAISGDTVVVGAEQSTGVMTSGPGAAYVFVKPGGGWLNMTETAKLTASDAVFGDNFGIDVSIHADTAIAGAPNAGLGGAAYLFTKPGPGWTSSTESARLTSSDGTADNLFGTSVHMRGDTAAVGAPDAPNGANPNPGAAYVFDKPMTGWADGTETAKLTAAGPGDGSFGEAMAMVGNTLILGAPEADPCPLVGGAVYLFQEPPTGWMNATETQSFFASNGVAGHSFGRSVALDGDTLVAGAPDTTILQHSSQGAAYVFALPYVPAPPAQPPTLSSAAPASLVNFALPTNITLSGTGLDCVDTVTVGGTPFPIAGQGPTFLFLQIPSGQPIGSHAVVVSGVSGSSNSVTVDVQPSHPSLLTAPVNHVLGTTGSYLTYTDANWASLYILAAVPGTTSLPGIVDFEIGGGLFGNLVAVITILADASGVANLPVTMPTQLFPPFTLYWECLTYDPAVPLGLQVPLETSNSAAVQTLF